MIPPRHRYLPPFLVLALCSLQGVAESAPSPEVRWRKDVLPILEEYCYDCHGEGVKKGDLELDRFESIAAMQAERGL